MANNIADAFKDLFNSIGGSTTSSRRLDSTYSVTYTASDSGASVYSYGEDSGVEASGIYIFQIVAGLLMAIFWIIWI